MLLPLPDLERSPGLNRADIGRLIRKEFDRRSPGLCVMRAQWMVILRIARRPGGSQREPADRLEMGKMVPCRQLDRLVPAGWLARGPDAADQRIKRLLFAPKTGKLLVAAAQTAASPRRDCRKGFAAKRGKTLAACFSHLQQNLPALDHRARIAAQ